MAFLASTKALKPCESLQHRSSSRAIHVRAAMREPCQGPQQQDCRDAQPSAMPRRELLAMVVGASALSLTSAHPAAAAGFKKELKERKIPVEEYSVLESNGLKYYDLEQGTGKEIKVGDTVTVHFDCMFRGIDAVSSRYARTLGGNRTVAEPYEYVVGEQVTSSFKAASGDSAGGLFTGTPGPKPPPALSLAVVGMKPGGKRSIIVDVPELGYVKGNQEIPPGGDFEMKVEVLSVVSSIN